MSTPTLDRRAAPLALTMGEPAGVGGEIAIKAWLERNAGIPPFFAIDDPERLRRLARRIGWPVKIHRIARPAEAVAVFADALPVLALSRPVAGEPGTLDTANAGAVQEAIETAVAVVMAGEAAAVVTNPIHKQNLYAAGFAFAGHTEFLAHLAGLKTPPVMMLACASLRVVPVTVHVSLIESIRQLTTASIVEKSVITATALRDDFAIPRPRLAVAGMNPHAGEGGGMGTEEETIVRPAIEILRAKGIDAFGPMSPDTMFSVHARDRYDAAICMYHDQALIPIKTLDFDGTVNMTLGLPFVRTSPDHGTALDIAGTGKAEEASLLAAMRMAARMAEVRSRTAPARLAAAER